MNHADDYKAINAIGEQIASFRASDETALVVGFGSHKGSPGCESGSLSVTVRKGGFEATSEALRLGDAIFLARGKVNREIEADRAAKEKAKAEV
ncbi:hypothetical protein [Sphingorhabdus sp. SMR4y]|uniref:hypothetical protein n=1 Tax=Sphingorhabdus sp. SMR4y TaxID=2584094 RepID=UPI000B5C9EE6|nr:hypothetical protein [Sphingorhabdus sp. SMR4y]ASK88502.1 hypothetical protein SPHFLASMR4Y_01755 [Sphingorhabdus sp. SMR4y]